VRIALCISGQPRWIERTYHEHIKKNLIDPNGEVDVFVHTWFDESVAGKVIMQAAGMYQASEPISAQTPEIITDLYHPKVVKIEPQRQFDVKDYANRKLEFINVFYQLSAIYSIWAANELKTRYEMENRFTYDVVIRLRFDFCLESPLLLSDYPMTKVYVVNNCAHHDGINDQFAFSGSYYMNVYSDLTNWIEQYYRTSNVRFAGECLIRHHLEQQGIPFGAIDVPTILMHQVIERERQAAIARKAENEYNRSRIPPVWTPKG